jgi:superoxide dismutase, Cu-Zn family
MTRIHWLGVCLALAGSVALAQSGAQPATGAQPAAGASAKAQLKDAKGQDVGEVTLRETKEGVLLQVQLRNVEPGVKAFHVHDVGRCEAPAFQSAGPHFNPGKHQHGLMASGGAHAGDMPNVHVPESRMLSVEVLAPGVTLSSGAQSLLDANGSAVVLHAKADDYATDPSGNAGDRVACGVVTK